MYTATSDQISQTLYTQVSASTLAAVVKAIGNTTATSIQAATDASFVDVSSAGSLLVVNSPTNAGTLNTLQTDAGGALYPSGTDAVTVTNTTGGAITILAQSSTFLELSSGSETVVGGDAATFVVDASHNGAALNLQAGSGQSYLIGGSGADTLSGSTSSTGHAVLVAKDGPTVLQGGLGADTLYGGGHTNLMGGLGAGQTLLGGFSPNAMDTLQAGLGGHQTLAVAQGSNLLSDLNGNGTDTLFSGGGSDTLNGSSFGTTFGLGLGHATVNGGTGNDNIFVAKGALSDSINGGGGNDYVTFNGYSHTDAAITTDGHGVTTIVFASTGQTATLTNVAHVVFGNDTVAHS